MRRPLAATLLLSAMLLAGLPSLAWAAGGTQQAPKLLNLFLDYQISADDPAKLAKWDIVVLDVDQQFLNADKIREIKQLNPNIKILAYVSASEIAEARFHENQNEPAAQLAAALPEAWFLHHADGTRSSWWPGTYLLNATDEGPLVNGQRWNTFLGPFIRDHVMSSGLWDGVFLDSAYGEITSFFGTNLDPNGDGLASPPKQNDEAWQAGMRELIQNVRNAIGGDKLILNNSSSAYADLTNGVLFENFPRYGWTAPFADLRGALAKNRAPKISAINTNTDNQNLPGDYQLMRYGLASALVADSYFSFDQGDSNHNRTWWYDEYGASIGAPRASAQVLKGNVWSRPYDRGLVLVNSTPKPQNIPLPGAYERLTGTQDPATNNGAIVDQVVMPPQDGLILLRRSDAAEIKNAAYVNGTFLQVYDAGGHRLRNGFFASRDDVPGGSTVITADLDRDGMEDVAYALGGTVTIRLGNGMSRSFMPFGPRYRGAISLAAGQTDGTAPWELVLAPAGQSQARILVTDLTGKVLHSWLAYQPKFKGGANVALGDLNGDGKNEIITVAGQGGGPHVQLFKTDGHAWGGGFFAFDAGQTGGAFVATGDLYGDGHDEIVVGSGPGAPPEVRIYDAEHILKSSFSLGSAPSALGVRPVVTDIDGDRKAEILIPGNPF